MLPESRHPLSNEEDRLMDELLREQSHGTDTHLLQRIAAAIDASALPVKRRSWHSSRAARAAAVVLLAGGVTWLVLHERGTVGRSVPLASETTTPSGEHSPIPGDPSSITLRVSSSGTKEGPRIPHVPHSEPGIGNTSPTELAISEPGHPRIFSLGELSGRSLKGSLGGSQGQGFGSGMGAGAIPPVPSIARSTGRYEGFSTQPWRTPLAHPLSTFSVDVDSASYANIRRMILENRPVPPEAVRIEECINAFRYHYAPPQNPDTPFSLGAAIATCPWNPANHLVRVAIKGREISGQQRPPALNSTLVPIAKDVQIQIEFNPSKTATYRLIGYSSPVLCDENFSNGKVDAGNIGAGHTVTAFYEIAPAGSPSPVDEPLKYAVRKETPELADEWLTVKLRYKYPEGSEILLTEFPLKGVPMSLSETDTDFRFAASAAMFGMKLAGEEEMRTVSWSSILDLAHSTAGKAEDRAGFIEVLGKLSGSATRLRPGRAEILPDAPLQRPR